METWILILPFLALPLFLFEQVSQVQWNKLDWNVANFLVSSVGLSVVHNYFTVALLFGLPEFQNWRREQVAAYPWLFRLRLYGVSLAILAFTLIVYKVWGTADVWGTWIRIGFTVISAHHSFSQSLGLSQAYTMQITQLRDITPADRERLMFYQQIEIGLKKFLVPAQFIWASTLFIPLFLGDQIPETNVLIAFQPFAQYALVVGMILFFKHNSPF